jgi:TnpA family transposase
MPQPPGRVELEAAAILLRFPDRLLADAGKFDRLVSELTNHASNRPRGAAVPKLTSVFRRLAVHPDDQPTITDTFELLCRLHDEGRDHIWGYYVRNLARPLWLSRQENRVDVLVGNPPWLAYRHMTGDMQRAFRAMCSSRRLWHGAAVATQQDLSALFLARTVQHYLRLNGRFAFVPPNAALDRRQFAGFRAGSYPDPVEPTSVAFDLPWDLRRLRPHFFPRASSVAFGRRTQADREQALPTEAERWMGHLPRVDATWSDVQDSITRTIAPLTLGSDDAESPYQNRFANGASVFPRVLFLVEEPPASPLGLAAGACNFGYRPVTDPDEPALTRARLSHVDQNYLRADTIKAANARLINAQADLELARLWGSGLVASVDGLRFVVPVATIYAGHNPRYFGRRRGATWINAMNDQRVGTGAQAVPGTARDSLYTLDVMLNPDHGRRPEMVTSDTAGYSDLVFGLYRVCGMQYAPRLADLTDTRFWRTTALADYGCLSDLARHRVRLERIRTHWPQMLRIAGSLVTGTVRAYDLIRALGRSGNPTPLGQAFAEYGRIAKTQHLLAVCDPDDDSYRRGINAQQNQTESRHRLARKLFFGQRGELRQRYQEGMEDQLGALGLVVNACVLWTTTYLDAALEQLHAQGYPVRDEDTARLSPFQDAHIEVHGHYSFALSNLAGGLRPLRDPAAPLDREDEAQA